MNQNQLKALRDVEQAALRIAMDAMQVRHMSRHVGLTATESLGVAETIHKDATQIKSLVRSLIRQLSPRGPATPEINGGAQ